MSSAESLASRSPWVQWALAKILPGLRAWPLPEWPRVLARARATDFDRLERIGTLASVLLSASLIRPVTSVEGSALLDYLAQFALVVPVFVLSFGPFYLRRIRRGIELAAHDDGARRAGEPVRRS